MSTNTKKFSGPALERYFERFFAAESGLSGEAAERLAKRAGAAFSSVRVRPGYVSLAAKPKPAAHSSAPAKPVAPAAKPAATAAAPTPAAAEPAGEFDAYAIGLVPTFQREGRDGLIAKLASVASADNLRKIARAQQIVLPEGMRQGDVAIDALRAAIADAVAKRIADRRAAAG